MARTELGMSSKEFFRLTWWEWGMCLLQIYKNNKRRQEDHELSMELTRQFMALFANANRSKTTKPFMPQDFWKLSYDTQITPSEAPTLEVFERLVAKHGKRKKTNGIE